MPTRGTQQGPQTDVDLTGGFRIDLKTGVLLGALLLQWWDGTRRADTEARLQAARDGEQIRVTGELNNRLVEIQAYMSNLKATLAAAGVADVDGRPIRRMP